ncbi:MAG: small subunit ribosomal protein S20 [Planctomycetota bacterium]|jgi:small subunit ribosomal protein S20
MPSSKQAKKRVVTDERKRAANKIMRTNMRSAVKKVLGAETADEAKNLLPEAMKRIDKCAKKNIIHDNAAARSKSRIARSLLSK